MEYFLSFAAVVTGADVSALGSPDWRTREDAESRLRSAGPVAWPALMGGVASADPEVRERSARLLAPALAWRDDCLAMAVVRDPWPVDPVAFWRNRPLRERVRRLAILDGRCPPWLADSLTPDDEWNGWCWDFGKDVSAARALDSVRRHFGNGGAGWPFSR